MNAKQKIHQVKLNQWAARFQEQASSGLTAKAWCAQNNFTIHTYNYWKHLLKQEYVDSILPDIVPLTDCLTDPIPDPHAPSDHHVLSASHLSCNSRELHELPNTNTNNTICISTGDIQLNIGPSVSEECVLRILKAVRYA